MRQSILTATAPLSATSAAVVGDRLLTVEQVSELCGWSRAQTYRAVKAGLLPPPITLGGRISRWRWSEVQAAIAALQSGPSMTAGERAA